MTAPPFEAAAENVVENGEPPAWEPSETGVFDVCIGLDNSVLFTMTFAGSGWVSLRTVDPEAGNLLIVGDVE